MAKPPASKPETDSAAPSATTPASTPTSPPPGVPSLPTLYPAVEFDKQSEGTKALAVDLYRAYIANSNGLTWDGRPCPDWANLGMLVQSHWAAAALEAMAKVRSIDALGLADAMDKLLALSTESDAMRLTLASLQAKADAEPVSGSAADFARAEALAADLKACRDQLALANAAVKERDQKLKAVSITGDQRAMKLASERTAMLDVECDKLRAEVARLEAVNRALRTPHDDA